MIELFNILVGSNSWAGPLNWVGPVQAAVICGCPAVAAAFTLFLSKRSETALHNWR